MGNCQAIDAATLVIQHPSGKVDKLCWSVAACDIMKMKPGHYVALLITTSICHTTPKLEKNSPIKLYNDQKCSTNSKKDSTNGKISTASGPNTVRITRVKLLRPMDTLALGQVYRLISTEEVMKGMVAKKEAKMRNMGWN